MQRTTKAAELANVQKTPRVYLLGNPDKPEVAQALDDLKSFVASHCDVVGAAPRLDGRAAVDAATDRVVVLGGDGTLIGVARSLGADQIPLIGVNVGKLGFLTEFSIDEFKAACPQALTDDGLIGHRMVLETSVRRNGGVTHTNLAINDCVIQAGPPFRIIRLGISIGGRHLTEVAGDGLIVSTPSGSTGHNLSAGGPIMQADVDAIILTPLNPHSLTHKPLVIEHAATIEIEARNVNEGTTAITDGQVSHVLSQGDRITIRRFRRDLLLVRNPRYARWHNLVSKLHWGKAPNYQ